MSFYPEIVTYKITNGSLNQHGDRICDRIEAGTDITTISNAMKFFIDKANKHLINDWQDVLESNVVTEDNHALSLRSQLH